MARTTEEITLLALELHKLLQRMKFEVVDLNAKEQAKDAKK